MLLSAENVSKTFGSLRAVAGADLTIDEGEIIGLIGPNGAGKSTFFNCLAGDTLPTKHSELTAVARLLGYPPGDAAQALEQDYRRAARHARAAMERLFYD